MSTKSIIECPTVLSCWIKSRFSGFSQVRIRFRVTLINEHFLSKRKLFIFTYGYVIAFNFVMVSPMQSALTAIRCATFSRDVEHRHGQMQEPLGGFAQLPLIALNGIDACRGFPIAGRNTT